jgi:HEAT repeats
MLLMIDGLESGLRETSYEGLRKAIGASVPSQRMFVALLLGKPGPGANQRGKLLCDLLNDPSDEVQIAAIESVRSLGLASKDILEALAKKLIGNPSFGVQTAIVQALGVLGPRASVVKKYFAELVGNDHIPESVRVGAAIILGGLGPQALEPLCRALSADHCVEVRQIAARALKKIAPEIDKTSDEATNMIRALKGSARHEKDPWVLERVIESLREVEGTEAEAAVSIKTLVSDETEAYLREEKQFGNEEIGELDERDEGRLEKIKALLDEKPPRTYASAAARAKELLSLTKQEIAARLTPILNAHLRRNMPETYTQKQAITSWVNAELRELGLAIRCPKTGRPAILITDIRGGDEEISRIRLEVQDEAGRRHRTFTGSTLPELELMEAAPRHEGLAGRRSGRS